MKWSFIQCRKQSITKLPFTSRLSVCQSIPSYFQLMVDSSYIACWFLLVIRGCKRYRLYLYYVISILSISILVFADRFNISTKHTEVPKFWAILPAASIMASHCAMVVAVSRRVSRRSADLKAMVRANHGVLDGFGWGFAQVSLFIRWNECLPSAWSQSQLHGSWISKGISNGISGCFFCGGKKSGTWLILVLQSPAPKKTSVDSPVLVDSSMRTWQPTQSVQVAHLVGG